MRNDLKGALFLSGALVTCAALAETASESLTRIEAETLVLKAREKQLEVQANILAKQQEIAAKQQLRDSFAHTASSGNPVIRSIEGIGTRLYAALQMADGSHADVQVGEVLPNGMKVVAIRQNEVIVETGGKRRMRLAAAASPPPLLYPSYPGPGPTFVPPLPVPLPRSPR
jgi:type IV pilus biogenesis protein PilP